MELYKILFSKEKIVIEDKLPFVNGLYYAYEYEKKSMQIGVICELATNVSVKQNNITISLTKAPNGIWYHAKSKWRNGLYEETTDGTFGVNIGGDFFIQAWQQDRLVDEVHVAVIPQVFSLNEYRSMQNEVVQLIESFSVDLAKFNAMESHYLKRVQKYLYPLHFFYEIVTEFLVIIDEIINSPSFDLVESSIKKHKQGIKRWTPQLILEASITEKEYLRTTEKVQTFNILEHRMIRYMFERFINRIESEMNQENLYIEWLQKDLASLQSTLDMAANQDKELIGNLQLQTTNELNLLEERINKYQKLKTSILPYLELELFNEESIPAEETHLFKMDVKYSSIYELYCNFESIKDEAQQSLQTFIKSLLKSPLLYEIWILLKMVEQFKSWGFNTSYFNKWIKEKYPNSEKLEGFDEVFELSNMPFRVRLMFNKKIEDVNMKPDYIIGFQNKLSGQWQWHTADAKYKVFNEKQIHELQKSIDRSAVRYKNNIKINHVPITSSVIIHPNLNIFHWNLKFDGGLSHSLSQFYVKPFDTSLLRIYFKRLLHHFGKFGNICPTCNAVANGSPKVNNPNILTYICSSCAEVWVSSHCWNCDKSKGTLYKYALDNYNFQVEKQWNVHCPRCYADLNAIYSQDASILKEGYIFKSKRKKIVRRYEYKEIPCPRCGGSGRLPEFSHIQNGQCFLCYGNRTIRDKVMVEVEIDYNEFSGFNGTENYFGKNNEVNKNSSFNPIITIDDLPF